MKHPEDPCPRCGAAGPTLEMARNPIGGICWFCRSCNWIGDEQSLKEGRPALERKGGKKGCKG
jgi:hypothetical protein